MREYLDKRGWTKSAIDRANVVFYHELNKRIAKKYGWKYSKSKM